MDDFKEHEHLLERELHDLNQKLSTLLHSIPDLIIFKDGQGRWLTASQFALSLFGLENLPYVGKTSLELASLTPHYQELLISRHKANEKAWEKRNLTREEVTFYAESGKSCVLDLITTPIFNEDGSRKALIIIGRDITERKLAEERIYQLAYYDPLTRLPNRVKFELELEKSMIVANTLERKFAVLYIDMDRFAYINDALGSMVGDQLLIQVSERLEGALQKDWLLARMEGDQFAILIPDVILLDKLNRIAQELIDLVAKPFFVEQYELFITVTIGMCVFPDDGQDVQTLLKHVGIALHLAKESGKNTYLMFSSNMDSATFKTFSLQNRLNKALSNNEFEVYYQPKIDIQTNRIIGAEALIRWNNPEWDIVPPNKFIPLAEETGLIIPITEWVKRTVCEQNKQWQDEGLDIVPISVNISVQGFMQKDFIQSIQHILQETGLESHYLEIEITESSLIDNEHLAKDVINQLRELGLKVALDDFGTGYSALSYLNLFQVDTIKIDRSFIQEIGTNNQTGLIVKGIINLIHSLNINVIAEGVETEEQLHFLRKQKCNQVQGYLYSKPVRAEEFKQLLSKRKIDIARQGKGRQSKHNKRKYFRLQFSYPLLAEMSIIRLMGKEISTGKSDVLIENLSLGGLSFVSTIRMDVRPDMILSFETTLLGKKIHFVGKIVWSREQAERVYLYGVEFLNDEKERDALAKMINQLTIKLRKNPILADCQFIDTDSLTFFKEKMKQKK